MTEKYKSSYTIRCNCFLFMATNKPVQITDAKSGIIRRLIDVRPKHKTAPIKPRHYQALMNQVQFELGAIAWHCLEVYRSMGKSYYMNYRPIDMMYKTDIFFNFVEDSYSEFASMKGVSLSYAYSLYDTYCKNSGLEHKMARHLFREELKNYF